MIDWRECKSVERDPQKLGGNYVFRGTRVPVSALFENLEAGATIQQFLEWFEGVGREQVLDVLHYARKSLDIQLERVA